jgi:hypothetical protein
MKIRKKLTREQKLEWQRRRDRERYERAMQEKRTHERKYGAARVCGELRIPELRLVIATMRAGAPGTQAEPEAKR